MPLLPGGFVQAANIQTALIFGKPGHGTTSEVIRRIEQYTDVLPSEVLIIGPPSILSYGPKGYDLFVVSDLKDYTDNFLLPARRKDEAIMKYKVIVHEKLNVHLSHLIDGQGSSLTQKDWGVISNLLFQHVSIEAVGRQAHLATVELAPDEMGEYNIALNRHSLIKLLPLFSNKVYCYVEPIKNENEDITDVVYRVETNPAIALAFVQRAAAQP